MKQINETNEESILKNNSENLKNYIIESCVYTQKYYGNRSAYVVRHNDTIYIGIIVKKTDEYIVLESPCKTEFDGSLSISPIDNEHIKINEYDEVYEPTYTDLKTTYKLIIHNCRDNSIEQVKLDGVLKQPLRYRVSTDVYPHIVEYHCYIEDEIYNMDSESTESIDNLNIDKNSIIDFGYLNEEKHLPLITIEQPNNTVTEEIPLLNYIITFSTFNINKLVNVVDMDDVIESTMHMSNHPYMNLYDECVGHIHSNQDLVMSQYFSAYYDGLLHFGDDLVISQNLVKWSSEAQDKIREIQNENDNSEEDQENEEERDADDSEEDQENFGFIVFGEKTENKRKIKHPFISAGVYSIPLSKLLPEKLNSYSYNELLEIMFNSESEMSIPSEWQFIINLLSNYDRDTDTYWINPVSRLHNMDGLQSRDIRYNEIYNVDIVIDAIQNSANKDTLFENEDVDFISDYDDGNSIQLAQRADIYQYQNTVSIVVPQDREDGQWVAKKEIFDEYDVDLPTTLTIQKGDSFIEYTDVAIVPAVDGDNNMSTPVEVHPQEIYEVQQNEYVENKYEPLVFGADTDVQQDNSAKLSERRNMSNTEFASMISNGSILPPVDSKPTYPQPL